MSVETGNVIAFGGTNARVAEAREGEIYGFRVENTPTEPEEFFKWTARHVLNGVHAGNNWTVLGLPGPVDGHLVGPMPNIEGLKDQQYNIVEELIGADSAVDDVLRDKDFTFAVVNDGPLVAHAVAAKIGGGKYKKPAGLIIGSGVGAGIVECDEKGIYRTGRAPSEIGHEILGTDPTDTRENRISGPALARRYNGDIRTFGEGHPAWKEVGVEIGKAVLSLGLREGADLVVPVGGVGINTSHLYRPRLHEFLDNIKGRGNGPQEKLMPAVRFVPLVDPTDRTIRPEDDLALTLEMYGGEGVIRDIRNPQA